MKTIEELRSLETAQKNYVPEKVEKLSEKDMQWFRDAKFGMFIHWGLYSLLGKGEWVLFNEWLDMKKYAALSQDFSAEAFDAEKWARTAKKAGMKYMVLTTRHHDGFCLFNSKASGYNSVNSAAKRDFVKEYAEACRKEGLKVGFYYSPMDWRYPGYFFPELYWESAQEMKKQCWEQLEELMTNYGKIDLLWFDGEWLAHGGIGFGENGWMRDPDWGKSRYLRVNYFWESEKLINRIRALQPGIMINNRGGWEGDFHVRERQIGGIRTDKPWDSNDCLARSWGYIPGMPILSLEQLIRNLVSIIVRDGNYLLNVGPAGDGSFDPEHVQRLKQLGAWLEKYGESVYGTRGGPVQPGVWGGCVYRENTVYVHITEWGKDRIEIPETGRLLSFRGLNCTNISLTEQNGMLRIEIPIEDRAPYDSIVRLDYAEPVRWDGVEAKEEDVYGLADGLG